MERSARVVGIWLVGCLFAGAVLVIANTPQPPDQWTDQHRALVVLGWIAVVTGATLLVADLVLLLLPRVKRLRNRSQVQVDGVEVERKPFHLGDVSMPADFIYVNVVNHAERPASTARDLIGHLWFYNPDGSERFYLRAKWAKSPTLATDDRIELGPGRAASLDVAWKKPDEENAFGLNSQSMLTAPNWEEPKLVLSPGTYRVRVKFVDVDGRAIEYRFQFTNPGRGRGLILVGQPVSEQADAQLAGGSGRAHPPTIAVSDALEAQIVRGPTNPGTNEVNWRTAGQRDRHIHLSYKPRALRFFSPVDMTVSTLPASVPVGSGQVIVTRFFELGFMVDEIGTSGDVVRAEPYPAD